MPYTSCMSNIVIKSSAFKEGETIPAKYTCEGENVNPFLEIRNVPQGTKSLALIMDDPDATGGRTWDHWIMWNIEPGTQYVAEDTVPHNAVVGLNSWGSNRYGGPCPPPGNAPHRYVFKLYALDAILDLSSDSPKERLVEAMEGHILEETALVGMFGR